VVKIVCEGTTDKNKLKEALNFFGIEYKDDIFIVMKNKSNFFKLELEYNDKYATLQTLIQADKIDKILFVIDADYKQNDSVYGGYENSKIAIETTIAALQIKELSDFYICCDPNTKDGYLESLLLSTVDENLKKCYSDFLDCIDIKEKSNHKNIMEQLHKITKPNRPYDFEHANFKELISKLKALFAHEV